MSYLRLFLKHAYFVKKSIKDFRILVYCVKFDLDKLNYKEVEPLHQLDSIYQNVYLLFENSAKIQLFTFDWFSHKIACNIPILMTIGVFSISELKWNNLNIIKKFFDFKNCELIVGVIPYDKNYFCSFSNGKFIGVIPDMLEIVEKNYNFKTFFIDINFSANESISHNFFNETYDNKIPDFIIKESTFFTNINGKYQSVYLGIEFHYIFAITPGELYTTYEKLLLPFDFTTWIFLILTFITAFSFISMFNLAKRNIKDLIYGKSIKHPALNVVSIFFGIALKKIAKENVSRILLILFIWFCLIFRTCYQSKMFEFMTSEMRKPSPQTINELFEQNFSVITQKVNLPLLHGVEDSKRWKIRILNNTNFIRLWTSSLMYDASAKLALLTNEENIISHSILKSSELEKNIKIAILEEKFCTQSFVFSLPSNNFFLEPLDHLMKQLIPTGIPQHSFAYHKFMMLIRKKLKFKKEPQVLTVGSLSFGFIIWLIILSTSFIALFGEIIIYKLIQKPKKEQKKIFKVKFAKIHPITEGKENEKQKTESKLVHEDKIIEDLKDSKSEQNVSNE
ncbi:hypothetical protein PVAND_002373 [Polypedilum vanderplanki]|uniref:Uncharacterized protein n=1 Tax=Polypedilum vanderplanki TaxID=319348 RepID=A0A9J6BR18_POLVA|nr:hypothetical protein PVAND_002373 [Polypedilum vanderplanki]